MNDFGSAFGPVQAPKPTADERKHIELVEKLAGIQAVLVDTTTVLLTLLEQKAHPPVVVQPDGTDLSPLIDALNRPYPVPPSAEALAEALARRLPDHGLALAAVSEAMASTAKQLERLNKKVNASAISPSGGSSGHVIVDSGTVTLTGSEFPWSSTDRAIAQDIKRGLNDQRTLFEYEKDITPASSTNRVVYIGKALQGTTTSAAAWMVIKFFYASAQHAEATDIQVLTGAWTGRATLPWS